LCTKTRQAIYVCRNIDALPHNNCFSGRAMNITYSEYEFVALFSVVQCACVVLYCLLWSVWLYGIFPHYFIILTFFDRFSKHFPVSSFVKIRPIRAELLHAGDGGMERRTYMTKLIVIFRNCANAPKFNANVI
jgi:hypothetical protein